jgi:hypothetical protein
MLFNILSLVQEIKYIEVILEEGEEKFWTYEGGSNRNLGKIT